MAIEGNEPMREQTETSGIDADYAALVARNRELSDEVERMTRRVEQMRAQLDGSDVAVVNDAPQEVSAISDDRTVSRRGLLMGAGAAGVVAATAGFALARPSAAGASLASVQQLMGNFQGGQAGGNGQQITWDYDGALLVLAGMDHVLQVSRHDPNPSPFPPKQQALLPGYVSSAVALYSDNSQPNSYAWTLFVENRSTNSEWSTQADSQCVAVTGKAFNRSPGGSSNVAGVHLEPRHGQDYNSTSTSAPIGANGVTFGVNCKLYRLASGGKTIGINVQNTNNSIINGQAVNADAAVVIESNAGSGVNGWSDGIRFNGQFITAGGDGPVGINMAGAKYGTAGVDLGKSAMRMDGSTPVYFDGATQQTYIWFNYISGQLEFVVNNAVRVAY
jgi:hypothetical protein